MEMRPTTVLSIRELSDVGDARRRGATLATSLGFDDVAAGKLALVITEAGKNILRHAKFGELYLSPVSDDAIEVIAIDQGPGMDDPNRCLEDGYSTAGTPGTGLGAIRRLSDGFSLFTAAGKGTALRSRIGSRATENGAAGLSRPCPGEQVCGDAWSVTRSGTRASLLLADGLGHGVQAAHAAQEAVRVHRESVGCAPAEVLRRAHGVLRSTRGAAIAVAVIDEANCRIVFAGIGNISAVVIGGGGSQSLVSHSGIVGGEMRTVQEFTYPWHGGATLVLHSDGITSRWSLDNYPGLRRQPPIVVAAILLRDYTRGRDDATALVFRSAEAGHA